MSKGLKNDLELLRLENENLKRQLNELNENMVISSMNDLKEKLEEIKRNSAPLHEYFY